MKENKNNEAAFPREWSSVKQNKDAPTQYSVAQKGLTKREYFAAKAMQGFLSNPNTQGDTKLLMKEALKFADAMLERLLI
jgi:hypothetical protein